MSDLMTEMYEEIRLTCSLCNLKEIGKCNIEDIHVKSECLIKREESTIPVKQVEDLTYYEASTINARIRVGSLHAFRDQNDKRPKAKRWLLNKEQIDKLKAGIYK